MQSLTGERRDGDGYLGASSDCYLYYNVLFRGGDIKNRGKDGERSETPVCRCGLPAAVIINENRCAKAHFTQRSLAAKHHVLELVLEVKIVGSTPASATALIGTPIMGKISETQQHHP